MKLSTATDEMARAVESIDGVLIGEDDLHCEALVLKCITGIVDVMVLRCAIKLHIFDAIQRHDGQPVPLAELAAALPAASVHHPTLRRVMRYLANMRLVNVHEAAGEFYTLTPASSTYLRVDSEKSFVPYARFLTEVETIAPFLALDACVVAGDHESDVPAIERLGGKSFYDMVALDPATEKAFDVTMRAMVRRTAEAVVEGSPAVFEGVTTVVDVGGGDGMMAATIARAFPAIKCVVLELAHVVERAPERVGVEFVAGDMFVSLPRADALLFTRVLHNWSDDKVIEILGRCMEAIDQNKGKVIIIDMVINDSTEDPDVHQIKLSRDIIMMAYHGGKERTKEEWRSLLAKVGFNYCTFTRVKAFEHVIEACP